MSDTMPEAPFPSREADRSINLAETQVNAANAMRAALKAFTKVPSDDHREVLAACALLYQRVCQPPPDPLPGTFSRGTISPEIFSPEILSSVADNDKAADLFFTTQEREVIRYIMQHGHILWRPPGDDQEPAYVVFPRRRVSPNVAKDMGGRGLLDSLTRVDDQP